MPLDESQTVRSEKRRKKRPKPRPLYRSSDSGEAVRFLNEQNRRRRTPSRGADTAEAAHARGMDAISRLKTRRANRNVGGPGHRPKDLGEFLAVIPLAA